MSEPLSGDPENLGRINSKLGAHRPAAGTRFSGGGMPEQGKKKLVAANGKRRRAHRGLDSTESEVGADNKGIKRVNDEAAERLKRAFHEPGEKKDPKTELLDSRRKFGPKHPIGDGGVHDTDGPVKPRDPHAFLRKTESDNLHRLDSYEKALRSEVTRFLEESQYGIAWGKYDARVYNDRLKDIAAIRKALQNGPDRHLVYLDLNRVRLDETIKAGVSIGDPFNADHVGLATPGKGTTVRDSLVGMTDEMDRIQRETLRQLRSMPGHKDDTAAVIAWVGYDAPSASIPGFIDAADSRLAHAAAPVLDRFLHTIHDENIDSHGASDLTLLGHSYGSLVAGLALKDGAHDVVDKYVFYGSPGVGADDAPGLGMPYGSVYGMTAGGDPIDKSWLGTDSGFGGVPTPTQDAPSWFYTHKFNFLDLRERDCEDGVHRLSPSGHSEYPRIASNGELFTSGYYLAEAIANNRRGLDSHLASHPEPEGGG